MSVTDTSLEAYKEIVNNGKLLSERKKILTLLSIQDGFTSAEIAEFTGIERHHTASRLSDMLKAGEVSKGDKAICTQCGRTCYTWEIVGGESC